MSTAWETLNRLLRDEVGQPAATRFALKLQAELGGALLRVPKPKRERLPSKDEVLDALAEYSGNVNDAAASLGVKASTCFKIANSPDKRWPWPAPRQDDISSI